MFKIAKSTQTLICIGTGGVGKTTLAASIGMGFANQGKNVLVLTIDPSLRLSQALGIKADGELHQIKISGSGKLSAMVINHKKAFETFIRSAADQKNEEIEKLLNNKLYQQLSGQLSGSQDFTSLVTLYHHVVSQRYDLVILDTPPAQHTWNFLKAPEKISNLFNEGVAHWFRDLDEQKPSMLKKIFNVGTVQVLKVLESLTGSEFIKDLSSFFVAIQHWQKPLDQYIKNCHKLLTSESCEFILVTNLDPSRLSEAQKLVREIKIQGYNLTSLVINRVPRWLRNQNNSKSARLNEILAYYKSLENELLSRLTQFKTQLNVYKCFELRQTNEDAKHLQNNFDEIHPVI